MTKTTWDYVGGLRADEADRVFDWVKGSGFDAVHVKERPEIGEAVLFRRGTEVQIATGLPELPGLHDLWPILSRTCGVRTSVRSFADLADLRACHQVVKEVYR